MVFLGLAQVQGIMGRISRHLVNRQADRPVPLTLGGRAVAYVRGQALERRIRGRRHLLRRPPAIAFHRSLLEHAEALGARVVLVTDTDTGTLYSAALGSFWQHGVTVRRGHGDQVALPLPYWTTTDADGAGAVQLQLL